MKKNNWLWLIPAAAILLYSQWNQQDSDHAATNSGVSTSQSQQANNGKGQTAADSDAILQQNQ